MFSVFLSRQIELVQTPSSETIKMKNRRRLTARFVEVVNEVLAGKITIKEASVQLKLKAAKDYQWFWRFINKCRNPPSSFHWPPREDEVSFTVNEKTRINKGKYILFKNMNAKTGINVTHRYLKAHNH